MKIPGPKPPPRITFTKPLFFGVLSGFILILGFLTGMSLDKGLSFTGTFLKSELAWLVPEHTKGAEVPSPVTLLDEPESGRVIRLSTIQSAVPKEGRFLVADLVAMEFTLYQDGEAKEVLPILTKGNPNTPFATPSGQYSIRTREENHFSSIGHVFMPYSMQFYGNYFVHGWPYYADGTPVPASYSGGCIRLSTEDAKKVYDFASVGTELYVYDADPEAPKGTVEIDTGTMPQVTAKSFLVADIDTGDVYLERGASLPYPLASVTKLVTGLVANETISFERAIEIPSTILTKEEGKGKEVTVTVGELLYPLLMESNNQVADAIAKEYGTLGFIAWMNRTAHSLGMQHTTFVDPSGIGDGNIGTAEDLYRLSVYLTTKKPFLLNISKVPSKTITSDEGLTFSFRNFNHFSETPSFKGGKVGHTTAAKDTMLSVFTVVDDGVERRVAVIVLQSENNKQDTEALVSWFTEAISRADRKSQAACVSCAEEYRTINHEIPTE
jgi:D-alanyl-D-alanine carboxypeptidase